MNNCGIYIIRNSIDRRVYIGSSKNIKKRFERHKSDLKCSRHGNRYLQSFVNKYGLDSLEFEILDKCNEEDLLKVEEYRINEYNSLREGFNLALPDRRIFTEEHKNNVKLARINSKFNKQINVIQNNIIIFTGNIDSIIKRFNVDRSSVYKIVNGKRRTHKGYTFTL